MSRLAPGRRQVVVNQTRWRQGDFVRDYGGRVLTPAEVVLIARYREPLSGRTLELGCGAGRVLGYLAQLGEQAHGADLSPRMVEYCRRAYLRAHVKVGDVLDPRSCGDGRFDAIWATDNLLDILDDVNRRRVLAELTDMIGSNGILIFSSHNLDAPPAPRIGWRDSLRGPWSGQRVAGLLRRMSARSPAEALSRLAGEPSRWRNRRTLQRFTYDGEGYAILNDETHDYGMLHYYIRRDDQERQLAEVGYGLIECIDLQGDAVAAGEVSDSPSLHYVAYPK